MRAGVVLLPAVASALLAIGAGSAARAGFPGTNGKIVFVRSATGLRGELWTVDQNGRGRRRMWRARRRQYALSPSWSPNGKQVAFTLMRLRANRRPISGPVWLTDGKHAHRLTASPARTLDLQPAWSPDGSKLAFIRVSTGCRADCGTIWVTGADGSGARSVATRAYVSKPAWSPDSSNLAFVYRPNASAPFEIAVVSADGTGLRPIAFTHQVNVDPVWAPDGKRLAFTADGAVYTIGADGAGETKISAAPSNAVDVFPDWSPDGRTIVFLRRFGRTSRGPLSVVAVAPGSDVEHALGRVAGRPLSTPVWSPDSQKIVFSAGVGTASVFVAAASGGVRRLGKGLDPDWQALPR